MFTVSASAIFPPTVSIFRHKYGRCLFNGEEPFAPPVYQLSACVLFDEFSHDLLLARSCGAVRQPLPPSLPDGDTTNIDSATVPTGGYV